MNPAFVPKFLEHQSGVILFGILQIHPQRFINAQIILRDVPEELTLVHDLLRGGEGVVVGVVVGVLALGVFD